MSNETVNKTEDQGQYQWKWQPDAKIQITGVEFAYIHNFLQMFKNPILCTEMVLERMIKDGTASKVEPKSVEDVPDEIPTSVYENDPEVNYEKDTSASPKMEIVR